MTTRTLANLVDDAMAAMAGRPGESVWDPWDAGDGPGQSRGRPGGGKTGAPLSVRLYARMRGRTMCGHAVAVGGQKGAQEFQPLRGPAFCAILDVRLCVQQRLKHVETSVQHLMRHNRMVHGPKLVAGAAKTLWEDKRIRQGGIEGRAHVTEHSKKGLH